MTSEIKVALCAGSALLVIVGFHLKSWREASLVVAAICGTAAICGAFWMTFK